MNAISTPSVGALRMFAPLFDDGEFDLVNHLSSRPSASVDLTLFAATRRWPTPELIAALKDPSSLPEGFAARLAAGDTIWVRKGTRATIDTEARATLAALRRHGPNRLLYVVEQDGRGEAGAVEMLMDGLLCGHVTHFIRLGAHSELCLDDWLELCQGAHLLNLIEAPPGELRQPSLNHVKANLLPGTERFDGPWSGREQVARSALGPAPNPPHEGAAVMTHHLTADTDDTTATIFGRYLPNGLSPGACYVVSLYVWLPEDFVGTIIGAVCDGFESVQLSNAALEQRACWQRVWVCSRLPGHMRAANPQLYAIGRAGSLLYSACWKLEPGFTPTDWRGTALS